MLLPRQQQRLEQDCGGSPPPSPSNSSSLSSMMQQQQQLGSSISSTSSALDNCQRPENNHHHHPRLRSHHPSSPAPSHQFDPFSAGLMKEITSVEVEIIHLERHLLSLYRTAFERRLPASVENHKTHFKCEIGSELQTISDLSCQVEPDMQKGGVEYFNRTSPAHGCTSSDDQSRAATPKSSSRRKALVQATRNVYDQQLQNRKCVDPGHHSLADHLGASRVDNALSGPDTLSEDIVRCISSIYCKLADPALAHPGFSISSTSSLSSSTTLSPRNLSDSWSPHCNDEAIGNCQFHGLKEDAGPYAAMTEVLKICLDDDTFDYASRMLRHFRSLVKDLEKVDPAKMAREEKLAFWINIHNALVMHAYLAYGTHTYARSTSIFKAAYNVGGHCINPFVIQRSILEIRSHYTAPWMHTLLAPGKKFKTGSDRHAYAIEYPEPLVHFALCSGAFSDPAVRVYTAKNVFQDLELAKREFIQASVYIHKETKIYLPKITDYFAKDMSLTMASLLEMVSDCVSEVKRKAIRRCGKGRPDKYICWSQQSLTFRYVFHREVAERRLSI